VFHCPPIEQLHAFLSDPAGEDHSSIADHVAECPRCQRTLDAHTDSRELDRWRPVLLAHRDCSGDRGRPDHNLPEADRAFLGELKQRLALQDSTPPQHTLGREEPGAVPSRIGPYVIRRRLGGGGMGVVYEGYDHRLRRVVAVKMLRTVLDGSSAVRTRLLREAEAVARLRHPNIVQIYDVSEAEDHPYLVLELVAGGTLSDRIAGEPQQPTVAARLVRLLALAIHHAHQEGIVHRDLKPANVLLEHDADALPRSDFASASIPFPLESAIPRITDFGLAKLSDAAGDITRTGTLMGTPCYMAPEQARPGKNPVGPPTDIHALGAILYKLLTGRPPFQDVGLGETLELVCTADPPPPRLLQPKVPRDLETICLKCLRKDPAERYATAAALADDLDRFLRHRPIQARPAGNAERVWRWARRNPAVAALATGLGLLVVTVIVGLSVGLTVLSRLNSNLDRTNDHLEENNRKLKEVNDEERRAREFAQRLLEDMTSPEALHFLETQPELRPQQRQFLQKVVDYYQDFTRAPAGENAARERRALAFLRMARLLARLGAKDESIQAFQKAVDAYAALDTERPDYPAYQEKLAESWGGLSISLGSIHHNIEAMHPARQALKIWQRLAAAYPADSRIRSQLASTQAGLASILRVQGDVVEAEALCLQAMAVQRQLVAEFPGAPEHRVGLAGVHYNLGDCYVGLGRPQKAEVHRREALALMEVLVKEYPERFEYRSMLGGLKHGFAEWLLTRLRLEEAQRHFIRSAELHEGLVVDFPRVAEYRLGVARAHNGAGAVDWAFDRPNAASHFQKAHDMYQALVADFPKQQMYPQELGFTCAMRALVSPPGKEQEALELLDRAIILVEPIVQGPRPPSDARETLFFAYGQRARTLSSLGRHAQAAWSWTRTLELVDTRSKLAELERSVSEQVRVAIALGRPYIWLRQACSVAAGRDEALRLARASQHTQAAGAVASLHRIKRLHPQILFDLARALSLCAAAAAGDPALRFRYEQDALNLLTRARDAGAFQWQARRHQLEASPDFATLRSSPHFPALLKGLDGQAR